jgi:hypothetical protein
MEQFKCTVSYYGEYQEHYQYKGETDENGKQIISGVYILKETLAFEPPEEMELTLEWT